MRLWLHQTLLAFFWLFSAISADFGANLELVAAGLRPPCRKSVNRAF